MLAVVPRQFRVPLLWTVIESRIFSDNAMRINTEEGHDLALPVRLRQAGRSRVFRARLGTREDTAAANAPLLTIAAKPLKDEWLIVVTGVEAQIALRTYRKR